MVVCSKTDHSKRLKTCQDVSSDYSVRQISYLCTSISERFTLIHFVQELFDWRTGRQEGIVPLLVAGFLPTMAVLLETSLGDLTIDLLVEDAPRTCEK